MVTAKHFMRGKAETKLLLRKENKQKQYNTEKTHEDFMLAVLVLVCYELCSISFHSLKGFLHKKMFDMLLISKSF